MTLNVRIFFVFLSSGVFALTAARGQSAAPDSPAGSAVPPEVAKLIASTPAWSSSVAAHAGAGYKDNLLLSHFRPQGSSFVRGGVETLLWHVPQGSTDYFGFVNAEASRYFSGETIDHDATVFAHLEWRFRHAEVFSFNLAGTGYYVDQVLDLSDTAAGTLIAAFKRTGGQVGPTARWSILPWLWLEACGNTGRETFQDGSNNATLRDATARVGWRPSERFELSVAGSERWRDYDTRTQYSTGGRPIDDSQLATNERELEARCDVTWGRGGHWKTSTRAGALRYADNGAGYLNYSDRHAVQEIEWSVGAWSVRSRGEAARKEYKLQRIGVGINPPPQVKDDFSATVRVERQVAIHWTIYGEYNWERSRSNDVVASYRMNEGLLGARWNWEK